MTFLPKPLIKRQLKSFLELVGYCRQVEHRDSECHGNAERDHPEGLWTISEGLVWGICGGVVVEQQPLPQQTRVGRAEGYPITQLWLITLGN